jgi:cob(I)alamin adenosyltransferase
MKIYTKTGDTGKTSLAMGGRVLKSDLRVEMYGTCDELNSTIGLVLSYTSNDHILVSYLNMTQNLLQCIFIQLINTILFIVIF